MNTRIQNININYLILDHLNRKRVYHRTIGRICYAMTINKNQGENLNKIDLYLLNLVFVHGQLYTIKSDSNRKTSNFYSWNKTLRQYMI